MSVAGSGLDKHILTGFNKKQLLTFRHASQPSPLLYI
jgi:hypothetical protein